MAISFRYLIFACLLSVAGVLLTRAESTATPQVDIHFTVFGVSALQGVGYLPAKEAKPVDLKFYNNYRSPLYAYKGAQILTFYDSGEITAARAQAKPTYPGGPLPALNLKPIAVCAIPLGIQKAFLLFFPRTSLSAEGIRYEIFVMNDDVTNIPAGSFIIINASRLEFAATINSQVVTVGRGVSAPFKAEKGRVSLKLSRTESGYENLTLGDQWKLDNHHRSILILFPITQSSNLLPDSRRLMDQLPPDSKIGAQ